MGVATGTTDTASPSNRKLRSVSCVDELVQMCEGTANDESTPPPVSAQTMVEGAVHLPPRYMLNRKRRDRDASEQDDTDKTQINTQVARIDIQINGEAHPTYTNNDTKDTNCLDKSGEAVISDSPQQREKDLTIALQWLRQEFQSLREQDKQLARQFISLRSAIRHLQITSSAPSSGSHLSRNTSFSSAEDLGWYTNSSSASDLDPSSASAELGSRPSASALRADDYAGDFRPRTQSMLEPRTSATASPKLTVRRFGRTHSKEYF